MDATECAAALVKWATTTCPDLAGSYDYDAAVKTQPLPDVAAYVQSEQVAPSDSTLGISFATFGLDQANVHIFRAAILLMVDPGDPSAASEQLQGFVKALRLSIGEEFVETGMATLGGLVPAVSPFVTASYDPPFVKFDDGTEGRAATFSLAVAELA